MPTVTTTVGGTSSNSYISVADATTYFTKRLSSTDWTDATTANQEAALIQATRRLNDEDFEGMKTDSDQVLAWPRFGTYDRDGVSYDSDAIPEIVKDAQCEVAIALLSGDLDLDDTGLEGFTDVTVGPISVTPRHERSAGVLPKLVRRILASVLISGENSIHLVRA